MSEVTAARALATDEVETHGTIMFAQKALLDHIPCLLVSS